VAQPLEHKAAQVRLKLLGMAVRAEQMVLAVTVTTAHRLMPVVLKELEHHPLQIFSFKDMLQI
jgi:hypothetical protein